MHRIPSDVQITLSDISEGMLRDARRSIGSEDTRFTFQVFDAHEIPFADETFDLVIANHVLFYCDDILKVCRESGRVLKRKEPLYAAPTVKNHMAEITRLVQSFDKRIVLSAEKLYDRFGRENGAEQLSHCFSDIQWRTYEDSLLVPEPEPLIAYVLSCHGNQNQYIPDRYTEFRNFVKKRMGKGFHISKDAGLFLCQK